MALDRIKVDPILGEKIHAELLRLGVETPTKERSLPREEQFSVIEDGISRIMSALGLDLNDDSLNRTPRRVARMYLDEVFWGLNYRNFPKVTTIENKMHYETMLIERNISVKSFCEHHILPFIGEAFIAYIPNKRIIGLSKINRIVEFFSRRPQVQERLTEQIFATLCYVLDTEDVAVLIRASHTCVKMRGAEDENSDTITARLGGGFFKGTLRNEFYQSIKI